MSKEIRRLFKQKRNEEGRKIVLVDKFFLQPATFIRMKRCLGRERDINGVFLLFSQMRLNSLAEETFDGSSKENLTDLQVCLYLKHISTERRQKTSSNQNSRSECWKIPQEANDNLKKQKKDDSLKRGLRKVTISYSVASDWLRKQFMYQALTNHNANQSKTNDSSLPPSKRGWFYPSKIIFFLCFGAFFLFVCFFSLI